MHRRLWTLIATVCLGPLGAAAAQCPGDLDDDALVGINDFLMLLGQWGPGGGTADLDGDGQVGIADFLALLAAWGPCPGPPDPCLADSDGDGVVGIADFLFLLGVWGTGG